MRLSKWFIVSLRFTHKVLRKCFDPAEGLMRHLHLHLLSHVLLLRELA